MGRIVLAEHVILMLLLICLRQLGESQGSQVEELGLWEVSTFMSFAYISTLHLVLTQYHCTDVLGASHVFLERREGGVFYFSVVFSSSKLFSIFYLIGLLQEEGERMICHQPYFMDKETKVEWLGDLSREAK